MGDRKYRGEGYGTETGEEKERAGGIVLKEWESGEIQGKPSNNAYYFAIEKGLQRGSQ